MGDKPARKTPVRKAPARKNYNSELEWLRAKIEYAEAEESKAAFAKVARLNKRIAMKQKAIADLTDSLNKLEEERTELINARPAEVTDEV